MFKQFKHLSIRKNIVAIYKCNHLQKTYYEKRNESHLPYGNYH